MESFVSLNLTNNRIKEPKEQVGLLQAFMNLFMDETFVENYKKQETPQNIYELITNYI